MNSKKVVTIYYGDDWNLKVPKVSTEMTRKAFESWHKIGIKNGVEFFRASISWYDAKKNIFNKAWAFRNKEWIKIDAPIQPDMIFDKTAGKYDYELYDAKQRASRNVLFFNHPTFKTLLSSKLSQYLIFEEFMAKSFIAESAAELVNVCKEISSETVVVKPLHGSGGEGIVIGKKREIDLNSLKYPVLIQEFIKNINGVPGFSKKNTIADLRLVYIDSKRIYAVSRTAKAGSFFTNFHQGATGKSVPEHFIPESADKMAQKIVRKLSIFSDTYYSLDFIFNENDKPILVEINTTPGLDLLYAIGDKKAWERNFDAFLTILK
ncbi:MAG: ATP-grasp domain-containing protein [Patescibacteria group bacterium]|nr:ATP-grasp domain-containing protein [Patescibacteria group bacterium]